MLDIDGILAEHAEVNEFVIEVSEDANNDGSSNDWSLTIIAPSYKQWQSWLYVYNKVNMHIVAVAETQKHSYEDVELRNETEKKRVAEKLAIPILLELTDFQPQLCKIGREIVSLAKSWSGVNSEFSAEKVNGYFACYPPQKLMLLAYMFLKNYDEWLSSLKKS